MKTLYITRHGKSSWKDPELLDFERPLNKRGKRDVPFMGKLMLRMGVQVDAIVTSPAVRAYTTARTMAMEVGYPLSDIISEEAIYEATAGELMNILRELPDKYNSVMIVGHNPGFTNLSNFLNDEYIDNIPTCGIVKTNLEIDNWKQLEADRGKIEFFEYPKKYFK